MPVLLVLLASALFGTTGTAKALGLPGVDPEVVGALRLAIGGTALGLIALVAQRLGPPRANPSPLRVAGTRRRRAAATAAVCFGVAGVVGYQLAFFAGVTANGVAIGTMVALGSAPTMTGIAGWAIFRRVPERRWFLATAGAILGVLLLGGVVGTGAAVVTPGGILASLAAGAAYACYTIASKALLDLGWTSLQAMGALFGAAGLIGVGRLVLGGGADLGDPKAIVAALWLGLGATTVAYLLFARGLASLSAATVSTLTLAEPLVAALLGVLVLGERLSATATVGILVLGASIALLALRRAPAGVPAASGAESAG